MSSLVSDGHACPCHQCTVMPNGEHVITVCRNCPCLAYHTGHGSQTHPSEPYMQEEYYHQPSSPLLPRLSSGRNSSGREHIFHHQLPGSYRTSLRRSQNGDLVLERRTSQSATARPETGYNHARPLPSPSLFPRRASTVSNTRSGRPLSQVTPDEESAEYLFEGSGEHYRVSLPMPPRASTRPTPPARTGANPMRPSAAPVRPVPSRRAPADPAPTHTQELNGTRGRKTDEQHVVLKNLVEFRQKFERNIKPQIQAMFVDSTLSRTQAKKGCEIFREMLIGQVVDPCRAAVCSDKLVGLPTTDEARATQLQEALIQDVKPWLSQLDQYIADLLTPESSFEKLDDNSGPQSEVGGVEEADGKRAPRCAGTAAFDGGEHEPYGKRPPRHEEALRRPRASMHTSQEEVSTNSKPKKRSGILDLRDIQYMRPNTRYANPNSGTLASRRNRAASGEGESGTGPSPPGEGSDADDYIKPPSVTSTMGYHRMSAGPKHDGELTRPKPKANVASRLETQARSIHASLPPSTSHIAAQPYRRRTPASLPPEVSGSPPAYSPSQGYSTRNVQASSRYRRATAESDSEGGSEDTTAELQRAFRRLSTGHHKQLNKGSGGEVFEGRGQRRR